MKDTPLLFAPGNVRKVLAGTKTQTRRIVKDKHHLDVLNFLGGGIDDQPGEIGIKFVRDCERTDDDTKKKYRYTGLLACCGEYPEEGYEEVRCPYGQPGDRLWVREAFSYWNPRVVRYTCDGTCSDGVARPEYLPGKIRPSIHLPKKFCRLWLELTDVRVERLQEITGNDVEAEGCEFPNATGITPVELRARWEPWRQLWNSINGPAGEPGSWEQNPLVWVLTFKRVKICH